MVKSAKKLDFIVLFWYNLLMEKRDARPTYDELMRMYLAQKERADSLEEEKRGLLRDNKQLADALAAVSRELGDKSAIIRRYNCERFYSKRDSVYKDAASAASKPRGRGGRKRGSKSFGGIDLEGLSKMSDPIVCDAADGLPEGERGMLVRVGQDESYSIEIERARVRVRKVIRPRYLRPDGSFLQSPSPAPISGSPAGASLLADAQAMKYALGVPAYRYAGWLALSGLPVPSQTATRWMIGAAEAEEPVRDAIVAAIPSIGARELHVDETPIEMLSEESGSGKRGKRGYCFAFSADGAGAKVRAYEFSKTRRTDPVDAAASGFGGVLSVDGYSGYDRFAESMVVQRCLCHARRRFSDLAKSGCAEALPVLSLFDAVFADEREIRESLPFGSPEEVLAARKSPARAANVEALRSGVRSAMEGSLEGSPMWRAARYFCDMEGELLTFASDGRASADNNAAERCCKKVALARRNFLFVQGERGGEAAAVSLTLIETAIANGVEPRGYLEWVLSNARDAAVRPEAYLPWSENVPAALRMKKAS